MNTRRTQPPPSSLSDVLRQAIIDSELPLKRLSREADVARASLIRFVRGERSLHLTAADKLAAYFGLSLVADKPRKGK